MQLLKVTSFLLLVGVVAISATEWHPDLKLFQEWVAEMNEDKLSVGNPNAEIMENFVNTKNGTIRGTTALTVGGKRVYEYLGVPYAAPPVGPLRFQPPQPYEGWGEGTFNATKHPRACMQYVTNLTEASEDCLFLSIYSRHPGQELPGTEPVPLLPVVFFIHGGGFAFGQNSPYTGIKLLNNQDIVLVTINYRLGPQGFMHLPGVVTGNNGMKDMVQGLRWVQENIHAFGGDKNQVTLMGESAGSASSIYILLSPLGRGLFNRVVAMSGTPLQEWAIDRDPVRSARRIGAFLNCTEEATDELFQCLNEVDSVLLNKANIGMIIEDFQNFEIRLQGTTPVVEGDVPGAFLPKDPMELILEGDIPDVPILLGSVQHEGILPLAGVHYLVLNPEGKLNDSRYMREELLSKLLTTWEVDESFNGASVSKSLALGYLKPGSDMADLSTVQYELLDMLTSLFMKAPILRTAEILSRRLTSPVYLYNFEHYNAYGSSLYNLAFIMIEQIIGGEKPPFKHGIMHADDLMYMFRLPFILSPGDTIFSRHYCQLFTNFFATGNPTPTATSDYPIWHPFNQTDKYYLTMDTKMESKQDYTGNWRLGMKGEH